MLHWEDQELNPATPEGKFPEVLAATFALVALAEKKERKYRFVDQGVFDKLVAAGSISQRASAARIDRVCLRFRLGCGIEPGGGAYPSLGVMHYWKNDQSRYAIVHVSPKNDWLQIMTMAGEEPNQPVQSNSGDAPRKSGAVTAISRSPGSV